jgi:hypothetical protein
MAAEGGQEMSQIMSHRHRLVLPDGTVQELEWSPEVGEGDLIAPAEAGVSDEPVGKLFVKWIEDRQVDAGPIDRYYHLEWF